MADLKKLIGKIRFVKVKSRKLTIIALIVAIVLSMGALTALHISMYSLHSRTEDLRQEAARLEAENEELVQDIDEVDSMHAIVEIAEEELGLVQPDSVFYQAEP